MYFIYKYLYRFATLVFKDEKTAEKNYTILQTKTLGNEKLNVDYVGAKSKLKKFSPADSGKLYYVLSKLLDVGCPIMFMQCDISVRQHCINIVIVLSNRRPCIDMTGIVLTLNTT